MSGTYRNTEELDALGKASSLAKGTVPIILTFSSWTGIRLFLQSVLCHGNMGSLGKGYAFDRGSLNPFIYL